MQYFLKGAMLSFKVVVDIPFLTRDILFKNALKYSAVIFMIYFSNRSQVVEIENVVSKKVMIDLGVSQKSILGPPLFNINQYDSSSRIKFAKDNTDNTNFESTSTENSKNA